ncbi:MAG: SprT-like domain-containing protein [Candidatus Pelagibacter bacterium]|nr:SprT-like domain-containing protein [Candidatus Pelagibacter bacterium]MBL6860931.1 SprT-like domain-containing protein [Candidatus Pelagibacter bacterium]
MIKKDIKNPSKKYTTNYKDIKKYFKYFNKKLFKNKLNKFNDIKIRKMKCSGQCVENISYYKGTSFFVLELKPRYKNRIDFLNTLSHEMLHLWQQTIKHNNGKHNKLFFSFKNKFKKLNLTLSY